MRENRKCEWKHENRERSSGGKGEGTRERKGGREREREKEVVEERLKERGKVWVGKEESERQRETRNTK